MSTIPDEVAQKSDVELRRLNLDEEEVRDTAARSRATARQERLAFPPIYVLVGAYRLATDKNLYVPAWQKCKHGVVRGMVVGGIWAALTFNVQHAFVHFFLSNSPRVSGLAHESVFGYQLPFSVTTYATILFVANQVTAMLKFFLSKNIHIARERAWDQTVRSRGKGPEFWCPYVEEWAVPPKLGSRTWRWEHWISGYFGRMVLLRGILIPLSVYPIAGLVVGAYLKAVNTARYLHKPYFAAKKMTGDQVELFMEERKWHYRAFGFAAALLENIPIIGLVFTLSNRVGAAMWAHDLEKRQHAISLGEVPLVTAVPNTGHDLKPMAGVWNEKDKTI